MIHPVFWPLFTAAAASQATAAWLADVARGLEGEVAAKDVLPWTTPNIVSLDLQTMCFRDFSARPVGPPVIICTPFALHRATIADFAPGHSVVERLHSAGISRVYVTDWRSATPDMRFLSIDNYLSDLNVAIDSFDVPVDLVGLCQGGWLAALYAARFPHKVRRLVLAGAPIDLDAGKSQLSELTSSVPIAVFQGLVDAGQGLLPGSRILELWPVPRDRELVQVLQRPDEPVLLERFTAWFQQTVTLPGVYYLQVVEWLFKENRIARGEFVALGRRVSLGSIRIPLFVLAASNDEVIAPAQLLAVKDLVGTPARNVVSALEPVGHLSLFLGARVLEQSWTGIGRWLSSEVGESKVDVSR
jgi:poly(3-hydroxyalkanoate) synthetase